MAEKLHGIWDSSPKEALRAFWEGHRRGDHSTEKPRSHPKDEAWERWAEGKCARITAGRGPRFADGSLLAVALVITKVNRNGTTNTNSFWVRTGMYLQSP